MTFEITYWELFALIAAAWILSRVIAGIRAKKVSFGREALLLLVFVCYAVIARYVYFPLHHVDGAIGMMKFDSARAIPPWVNLVPVVNLFERYDGWLINIIGNVTMFIPVGIVWPVCYRKLDTVGKTVLAGFGLTLFIELTQLPFYERCSDVDDLLLNTAGAAIGALILFGCRRLGKRGRAL